MNREKIGLFLAQLRKDRKMTQEELAMKLFVDRATISKWERGYYIPTPETILELSKFFDVSVNEILLGEKSTDENKSEINKITVDLLNSGKKIKLALFSSITMIIFLLFLFFINYFVNNYDTIKVYQVDGHSEEFLLTDAFLFISKEKVYIGFGDILGIGTKKANVFKLFYEKDGENIELVNYAHTKPTLFVSKFDEKNLTYQDIQSIKDNLYLEFSWFDEEVSVMKLNLTKDFSNNSLFPFK